MDFIRSCKKEAVKTAWKNKYGNTKVQIGGQTFDSKHEARRWQELVLLEKAGEISNLQRQVKFELIPAQYEEGELYTKGKSKGMPKRGKLIEREIAYYADFVYFIGDQLVVEDAKGYRGGEAYKVFTIKRKLMLYLKGIRVKEV